MTPDVTPCAPHPFAQTDVVQDHQAAVASPLRDGLEVPHGRLIAVISVEEGEIDRWHVFQRCLEGLVEQTLARMVEFADAGERRGGGGPVQVPALAIADVCAGSGCIAIALARWLPAATITAIDVSPDALAVAGRNALRHDVAGRVVLLKGDLLEGVDGPFDAIVSNPPYVPTGELDSLQPEVRDHEPAAALDGGPDGLDVIRRLVPQAARRLRAGGWLLFELGFGQADAVRAVVAAEPGFEAAELCADLAGIPRVAIARRRR